MKPSPRAESDDFDILSIAPPEDLPTNLPPSTVPQVILSGKKRKCPACGKEFPAEDKICVECGVYLDTGRSILITQDEHLDQIYVVAERTIWVLSWIIWLGVYPIASEAFGLRKPWVVRGIAILTVLTSLAYLGVQLADAPAAKTFDGMMLWCGDASNAPKLTDQDLGIDKVNDPELKKYLKELAQQQIAESMKSAGEFRPYQLVTYAFLHVGFLHLAGNMLFLMVLGTRVNALIGNIWTFVLYPILAAVAGIAHTISVAHLPPSPMLGASGAVMGLAGMYLVLFPVHKVHMAAWMRLGFLFRFRLSMAMFAVRGFWVVLAYIALDVAFTLLGVEDNVAHWAHIGGFAGGVVIALIMLLTRLVDAQGGDLLSVVLGRHARKLLGR